MQSKSLALFCLAIALLISGCKLVKNTPDAEGVIAADASGDDARNAARLDETFDAKLIPHISSKAQPLETLASKLGDGLDKAGQAYGVRSSGAGSAWNFAVTVSGTVVEAKLDTRARTAGLDSDGDGTTDAIIQLGPVVKGTALRDIAPFYNFDDFRDQIEYAKLARALNTRALGLINLPESDLIGRTMSITGVVALRSQTGKILVTPIDVEMSP
ncbi:MAG: DUF2291 domain-containing protein [Gammaproteobacteria bacterium]|nr:DUF2291 domain-containing protein [Gammaproteobacteria bacterium]